MATARAAAWPACRPRGEQRDRWVGTPGGDRPVAGDVAIPGRTDEEIQIVFDRYKAALYRLYNKELRAIRP